MIMVTIRKQLLIVYQNFFSEFLMTTQKHKIMKAIIHNFKEIMKKRISYKAKRSLNYILQITTLSRVKPFLIYHNQLGGEGKHSRNLTKWNIFQTYI